MERYVEEGFGLGGTLTVTPKQGYRLLCVKAQVENIDQEPDKLYELYAFGISGWAVRRRLSGEVIGAEMKLPAAYHWMDESLLALLDSLNDEAQFAIIGRESDLGKNVAANLVPDRNSPAEQVGGRKITATTPVSANTAISVEAYFFVPEGQNDFRLFVFGARPVKVTISPDGK